MSDRYQVLRTNRVWTIIDNEGHVPAGEPFRTKEGAEFEAAMLNLKAWRAAKPATVLSEPLAFEDAGELEDSLLAILDKCHGPDELWRRAA